MPESDVNTGLLMVQIVVGIIGYVYMAICLQVIADKTGTDNGWLAWIPIANIYLMLVIADKPIWWLILLFIPCVNIVWIVFQILIWMAIAEERGKPSWLGILIIVPIINIAIPGILAFSD
ncbi:hypothetical protein JXA32_11930 [Candidatus Sumerlaeota bacterium]|nr:hypothetical protein [Candidatus Sumerlaeota bacterium]